MSEVFYYEFAVAVCGAMLGGVLLDGLVRKLLQYFRDRRGWLAGKWTQSIPMLADRPAREDKVICLHHGERVWAKIIRVKPKESPPKQWVFDGALRQDGSLVGFFLGVESNSDSYGVIFMRKRNHNMFEGHYQKLLNQRDLANQTTPTEILTREHIDLKWTRVVRRSFLRRLGAYLKGRLHFGSTPT